MNQPGPRNKSLRIQRFFVTIAVPPTNRQRLRDLLLPDPGY
jgi:hypothetical protein